LKNARREPSAARAAGRGIGSPADAQVEHLRSKAIRPVRRKSGQQRFCGRKCRVQGPAHVIEAEVYGGRNWQRVVSSDGVVVEIARLRPRALKERRGTAR
jgi:hypothetical protein